MRHLPSVTRNLLAAVPLAITLAAACLAPPALDAQVTHTNPVSSGADPFVTRHAGSYHYLRTTGGDIKIRRSSTLQGIGSGIETTVFWPNQEIKGHIWAPELHYLSGKWYIYATGSLSSTQLIMRMFVLEGNSQDPMGTYTYRGLLEAHTGALDQTPLVRDSDGALFLVWSQWDDAGQSMYIGPMSNPLTLGHPRVRISTPDYPWERNGAVNEGPIILKRNGRTMIVYSGSGTWTPDYCLGMLVNTGPNYLDPASWVKASNPIFRRRDANNVYCVGHNGFTESPSGNQSWIAYHATNDPTGNQESKRNVRIQRFGWWSNNTPNLDVPVPTATQQISPDEAPGAPERGLRTEFFNNTTLTGTPAVTGVTRTMDFEWGNGSPVFGVNNDNFSGRWTGAVYAPVSGNYTFETTSDDGARLWLRDEQVINQWVTQAPTAASGTIYLEGGQFHPLRLEYFEAVGGASLTLRWAPPGVTTPVLIPAERLFPQASGLRGDYFSGANFNTHVLTRLDPAVAFDWGLSLPDIDVPANGFSVRWTGRVRAAATGTYTFHTRSDDGVRLWVAGTQLIDDWNARLVTENSGTIHLNAGVEYNLTLEYFDNTTDALCELLWTPPGGTKAVIPSSALFPPGTGSGPMLSYTFDEGTLGGWTDLTPANSNTGPRNWTLSPPAFPGNTEDGAGAVGQNIPGGNQDSSHPTLRLRSPEFTLNGSGHLTAWLKGGTGTGSLAGTAVSALAANSADPGFQGIALRNATTGQYVLSTRKSSSGDEWQQVSLSATQLAALDQNARYTLDLIDQGHGGWGWVAMDTVLIPGTPDVVNTAPTISNVANRTINEDGNTGAIAFTIGDVETAATALTLTGSSSNTGLVPNANIVFGGSGANRTVTVTPAANQSGTATITLTVSDGVLSTGESFLLTVLSSATPLTYNFDDGTLQGWTAVSTDSQGRQFFALVPLSLNSPNTAPLVDSHFIGLHIPAFTLTAPAYTQDGVHGTLWLRSPEFTLNGAGGLSSWLYGGGNGSPSLAGTAVSALPVSSSTGGFRGIALRNATTGQFVLSASKTDNANSWEQVGFTAAQLAALPQADLYTLDFIDAAHGDWGWVNMDSVSIPGNPASLPDPFVNWASGKGLSGVAAAFDADPDGDGIPNGLEFLLGGQPNPALPGSNSRHLLPTGTLDGDLFVFSYSRSHEAAYLAPVVEFATDLAGPWTAATAGENAVVEVLPGVGADTVHTRIPTGGESRLFARLRVNPMAPLTP